ncbi:methyl-accepting chemotaxis protein [Desulfatitalea alkaliphila]|uniref:Methyl-accepting chemotaxis protein n=1 Tax=Desulfatitalea alkaliphila TaxID=2929485 RepID=A0AA41UHT5_9BACT|nr:methyl-accepting chemotaxis protein [Desulfatitalea alkaliphila]MCJ8498957.1 methyl-accepting chemotaxis protein [Desulfatitalea alkaliphila]
MKRLSLKGKMIIGSLTLVILVMLISTTVVTVVINGQYKVAADRDIDKAIRIARDDLLTTREKMADDTRQMATVNTMGAKVKFISNYKGRALNDTSENLLREITTDILQIANVGNLWQAAIYDREGDLVAFALRRDAQRHLFAYTVDRNAGTYRHAVAEIGATADRPAWEETDAFTDLPVALQLEGAVPDRETVRFAQMGRDVCLVAYVPVLADDINRQTGDIEQNQYGVAVAVRRLDGAFAERIANLTGLRVNIFNRTGLSAGTMADYKAHTDGGMPEPPAVDRLEDQAVQRAEVALTDDTYFQGSLPLYAGGDRVGVLAVLESRGVVRDNLRQMIQLLLLVSLGCILFILPVTAWLANALIKPIRHVSARLQDIAEGEGDLTSRLEIQNQDEVGDLARWFNAFIEKLQEMIRSVAGNARTISHSSDDFTGLAGRMSAGANDMAANINGVSASAEQMSASLASVAGAMEQTAANVSAMAASVEEMTNTINEIAKNSETARHITEDAVAKANRSSARVGELGTAAREISKVTETITGISEQTNLLALNATIEAARAGDAGKGFAVVANEIKELAKQTAAATLDIKGKIESIQGVSSDAVTDIGAILTIIGNVNDVVGTIATAVEEQSVTAKEIAQNVSRAAEGIQEVNASMADGSNLAQAIATDIAAVNKATEDVSTQSDQVNARAGEMSALADALKGMVSRFKV